MFSCFLCDLDLQLGLNFYDRLRILSRVTDTGCAGAAGSGDKERHKYSAVNVDA